MNNSLLTFRGGEASDGTCKTHQGSDIQTLDISTLSSSAKVSNPTWLAIQNAMYLAFSCGNNDIYCINFMCFKGLFFYFLPLCFCWVLDDSLFTINTSLLKLERQHAFHRFTLKGLANLCDRICNSEVLVARFHKSKCSLWRIICS